MLHCFPAPQLSHTRSPTVQQQQQEDPWFLEKTEPEAEIFSYSSRDFLQLCNFPMYVDQIVSVMGSLDHCVTSCISWPVAFPFVAYPASNDGIWRELEVTLQVISLSYILRTCACPKVCVSATRSVKCG